MGKVIEKLKKMSTGDQSGWVAKARWRVANEKWLDKSSKIALKILRTLRARKMSQAELANLMSITPQQISKIVKGEENLTLETISKIESVLGIDLVEVSTVFVTTETVVNNKAFIPAYKNSAKLSAQKQQYSEMFRPRQCKIINMRKDAA